MKTILRIAVVLGILVFPSIFSFSQVSINNDNSAPDNSSILDVKSETKGVLIPRMTTVQRDAIISPSLGLMIFNLSDSCIHYFNGTYWVRVNGTPMILGGSSSYPGNSCKHIHIAQPTFPSGIYWVDSDGQGGNQPVQCYCDMITDGGGWTLVANNSSGTTAPTPNYAGAKGSAISMNGTLGLATCDLWIGLTNWINLGNQLMYQVGNSPGTPVLSAKYTFNINSSNGYQINLSNQVLLMGTTAPGIYSYHNGQYLSTFDYDHDNSAGSCSASYGNTTWWYNNCWMGSIWGSGGTNGAHWDTSSGSGYNWGALWVR